MTTPSPEHVDAIMDEVAMLQSVGPLLARRIADGLLESTDPAVHAAMLDALTRHGVLTRQVSGPFFDGGCQMHYRTEAEPLTSDEALTMLRERLTEEPS